VRTFRSIGWSHTPLPVDPACDFGLAPVETHVEIVDRPERVWAKPSTLSVVICCYTEQRWDALCRAIASILAQTRVVDQIVIVVDHQSALLDRVRDEFPDVTALANEFERGLSGARNTGVRHATADVVAFLDDDAVAPAEWAGEILGSYAPEVAAVGGAATPRWAGAPPEWLPPEFLWVVGCSWRGLPIEPAAVRNLIGTNMSVRREVLDAVGAFAASVGRVGTQLAGCEETELCIRINRHWPAAKILYLPDLAVEHHQTADRATITYFMRRCWSEGKSKARVTALVGGGPGLESERRHVLRVLPAAFVRSWFDLLRRRRGAAGRVVALPAGLVLTSLGFLYGRVQGSRVHAKVSRDATRD
jgi:cellulose synthase/poly-beta-1,6-N-acetylglucosamine synthase-like glycosyltransferase